MCTWKPSAEQQSLPIISARITSVRAAGDHKEARRNNLRELGIIIDAEVAANIARDHGAHPHEVFTTNKSSWSLPKLHVNFCSLLPGVGIQENPQALCGYKHDTKTPRPVVRAIHCRYIDIGHITRGYNKTFRVTNIEAPILPRLFPLDLDSDKPLGPFRKLFPKIDAAADIFEHHNIPRPLCTITNPLTKNAHAVYGVRYSADELDNPHATAAELKKLIKEIRKWIGGDPGYAGFTIRGPAYIAGWHKDNPTRECGNYIDTVTQSLWHETTWYEPHLYTLDELRELAKFLKSLHAPTTNQEFVAALGETPTSKKKTVYNNENDVHSLGRPTVDKKVANIIPDGERNVSMFDLMRQYAYRNAWRFNNDTSALAKHLFEKFSSINTQRCSPPLPACAIRATSYSVAKFCIMKGFKKPTRKTSKGYTDEDRAYAHLIKYGPNHVTQKEIAATEKVCVRTIIRRNKKSKEAAARLLRRQALSSFVKRSNGPQRNANGRIIYTSIPPLKPWDRSSSTGSFINREDDSCHDPLMALACTTARGPP